MSHTPPLARMPQEPPLFKLGRRVQNKARRGTRAQRLAAMAAVARIKGPNRVLLDREGTAVNWQTALSRGAAINIILVRDDGWTLGAPMGLEEAARLIWPDQWIGFIRRPPATGKGFEALEYPMSEWNYSHA